MNRRRVVVNTAASVLQVIGVSIAWLLLSRFLLRTIGAEKMGIWSVVLAAASATHAGALGLPGSLARFVAKYAAYEDHQKVSRLLQTAYLSTGLSLGIVLLVFHPVAVRVLPLFIAAGGIGEALTILPPAMMSVWLMALVAITMGAFDGYQRMEIRSGLSTGSTIIYAIFAAFLVRKYGLLGLAYAQILQYLCVYFFGVVILRAFVPLPFIPRVWDRGLFREMIRYGASLQLISLSQMAYGPTTKALLASFGGLSMVGYYEIAERLVIQLRSLIVAAHRVLVPIVAELTEVAPKRIQSVYATVTQATFFVSIPFYSAVIIFVPVVSLAWIGKCERYFVWPAMLCTVGWALNTLTVPSYNIYMGTGSLKWNTLSHILTAVLNIGLGWSLGSIWKGWGVIIGWVIALMLGSILVPFAYHIENHSSWRIWTTRSNLILLVSGGTIALVSWVLSNWSTRGSLSLPQQVLLAGGLALLNLVPAWYHPVRRRIQTWLVRYLEQSPRRFANDT